MTITEVYANDMNVSAKAFDRGRLHVAKIFGPTIQGEGPLSGTPCVFVRLSGCNRGAKLSPAGCDFCDADFRMAQAEVLTPGEVFARVHALFEGAGVRGFSRLIVISGGEPLLQLEALQDFAMETYSRPHSYQLQLETNGDYISADALRLCGTTVISPKCGNKGLWPGTYDRVVKAIHEDPDNEAPIPYFKLLVSANPASHYATLPPWFEGLRTDALLHDRIYLQPLTVHADPLNPSAVSELWMPRSTIDHEATRANHLHAAALAIQHGVKVSAQTHLLFAAE